MNERLCTKPKLNPEIVWEYCLCHRVDRNKSTLVAVRSDATDEGINEGGSHSDENDTIDDGTDADMWYYYDSKVFQDLDGIRIDSIISCLLYLIHDRDSVVDYDDMEMNA